MRHECLWTSSWTHSHQYQASFSVPVSILGTTPSDRQRTVDLLVNTQLPVRGLVQCPCINARDHSLQQAENHASIERIHVTRVETFTGAKPSFCQYTYQPGFTLRFWGLFQCCRRVYYCRTANSWSSYTSARFWCIVMARDLTSVSNVSMKPMPDLRLLNISKWVWLYPRFEVLHQLDDYHWAKIPITLPHIYMYLKWLVSYTWLYPMTLRVTLTCYTCVLVPRHPDVARATRAAVHFRSTPNVS